MFLNDVKKFAYVFGFSSLALLAGCKEKPKATDAVSAMEAAGYWRAPEITAVTQADSSLFVVLGQTIPNARVRFGYGGQRAVGVTSDSKGNFRAELPTGPDGGLYDLSTEDNGRSMHADGRLFIPGGAPEKAVLMRSGAPSLALFNDDQEVAVIDYDRAGALAIAGRVAPSTAVEIMLNGEIRARTISDDRGFYSATTQIDPPGDAETSNSLSVSAGGKEKPLTFSDSRPKAEGDHITRFGESWRVDWSLPGGGMQTTLVF
ncbi:MAG: hypothetical protein QM647_07630 [Asticcacaulis sp.]|uniref:hypothetical protein n=1 Tax=Asticcacaulis sp. TaxID=1872648 RepID=UPI0039E55CB1